MLGFLLIYGSKQWNEECGGECEGRGKTASLNGDFFVYVHPSSQVNAMERTSEMRQEQMIAEIRMP